MTERVLPSVTDGDVLAFDPEPIAARVRTALDSYLRERAPDQRLAFWKAVAFGYGGTVEDLAGCPKLAPAATSP